jgi:leucyl-tRNA synthetase
MKDLGLVKVAEPFRNLLTQGMVLNDIYSRRAADGRVQYFNPADVEVQTDAKGTRTGAILRADGQAVDWEGMRTMSKSKNNGVDPQKLVNEYGADSIRLFMMFKAPPEDTLEWSDDGVEGAARFMRKLWRTVHEHFEGGLTQTLDVGSLTDAQRDLRRAAHATLAKVTDDIGRRRIFNTAIAAVMELMNTLAKFEDKTPQGRALVQETLELAVQMLSPIIPHATHVMWQALGHGDSLIDRAWPQPDPQALVQDTLELVVQVNGKLRSHITVPAAADKAEVEKIALADANVQRWMEGKPARKVIVVLRKLVNVVV